jgi:hypothetical protein
MKRKIILPLLAAALAVTSVAAAHTLSPKTAAREAKAALRDWAEARERAGETLTDVDLTRRDCRGRSRHRSECHGSVEYEENEYGTTRLCFGDVRVRFASLRSQQIRTRVYNTECVF